MNRSFLFFILIIIAVCPLKNAFALTINTTDGVVTSISGLIIEEQSYDAIFHRDTSFHRLWDINDPVEFDNHPEGALLTGNPTFWGDSEGALFAAAAISTVLGRESVTDYNQHGAAHDGFLIPYGVSFTPSFVSYGDFNSASLEEDTPVYFDLSPYSSHEGRPIVSFRISAVPVPSAGLLLLFGMALLAAGTRYRN